MQKEYDVKKARRGAIARPKSKTRITIYLDDDVLEAYRARAENVGRGYQTLINEALRSSLGDSGKPLDAKTLRRILREELKKAG